MPTTRPVAEEADARRAALPDDEATPLADRPWPRGALDAAGRVKSYAITALKAPRLVLGKKRYILLLSHPRGFTSLFSHILGSHPEICGSCELFQPYRRRRDLWDLRYKAYWFSGSKAGARYFFDKVLFNTFPIDGRVLNDDDVEVIFMLRKPAPTITSMVRRGRQPAEREQFWGRYREPENACDLYVDRLRMLADHAGTTDRRPLYLDAEDILDQTDRVLEVVRDRLALRQPLSERYQTFGHTGISAGDNSPRIRSGKIDRDRDRDRGPDDDTIIPEEVLARAERAYDETRDLLRSRCLCP